MATVAEMLDAQRAIGEAIKRIVANYKKDPLDRKQSSSYFDERLRRLNTEWDKFEQTDTKLRTLVSQPFDHEYFIKGYYDEISGLVNTFKDIFKDEADRLKNQEKQTNSKKDDPSQNSLLAAASSVSSGANAVPPSDTEVYNNHKGLIRKLTTRLALLERLLTEQSAIDSNKPRQFYKINIENIKRHWSQIEVLYDETIYNIENPSQFGFDNAEYNRMEKIMQQRLVDLSILADQPQPDNTVRTTPEPHYNNMRSALPLPKVTLPQFNGDYLKWKPFFDLFTEIVDKQPLPQVQKMWYLKANVSGEAENLIGHLSLTEGNYATAWTLLQERYNNTRAIVASLIEKILNQPTGTSTTAAIKGLHDTTKECLLAIKNLDIETSSWDPLLLQLLIKKLDRNTHIRFEQSLSSPKEIPRVSEFLSFLEFQFQSMETIGKRDKPATTQSCSRAVSSVAASNSNSNPCKMCNIGGHRLYKCKQFLQLLEPERLNWVQRNGFCVNCLGNDHTTKTCTWGSCKKCDKKHNTLLHLANKPQVNFQKKDQPQQQTRLSKFSKIIQAQPTTSTKGSGLGVNPSTSAGDSPIVSNQAVASAASNPMSSQQGYVLLATAKVRITANNGQSGEFRAILDSGSQINIVTERLINRLSITTSRADLCIEGIGGKSKNASQRVNVNLQATMGDFSTRLEAFVLPSIIPAQPNKRIDISTWHIPKTIQLADPNFNDPGKIDILLGAEHYFNLITTGRIETSPDLPALQNTKLGWITSGKIDQGVNNSATCAIFTQDETTTNQLIEQFWKVDGLEAEDNNLTLAERECETHFMLNTTRGPDGRFIVRLPFIRSSISVGESRNVALSRFYALERRLHNDSHLKEQYVDFMDQYESLGHMKRIEQKNIENPHFYIPHHCVLRPESTTTKLRVVFDASAKASSGLSLNEIMYTGPTVQGDLFGMLLRFRLPRFVFCTDIEKMYRQILVHPADRNMQLIFWRKNQNEPIQVYKLNTVTYGTSSAPYLATKCLQQLAERNMEKYPLGAPTLKNDFYVDDGMSGSDSLMTAIEMQRQLTQLLLEAGFRLRKWSANHSKLLQNIPPEDLEVDLDFENASTKVLGLTWMPRSDMFALKVNIREGLKLTKRSVTSDVARIFDPLGIAGPVVVAAKIFIQKLWQLQISWDEQLPTSMNSYWSTFRTNLKTLNNTHTKRHMFDGQKPNITEIHTFVDASEQAYGSAVYLRSVLQDGRAIVRLLCAKSRIAPLKGLTLPRLELCAAVLGAELTAKVQKELHYENNRTCYWSDSEIVLHWINTPASSLRSFVANRTARIQQLTREDQWRHVSSKDNPADLISRGLSPDKLMKNNLWFYGPIFLHGKESHWPKKFSKETQAATDLEFKQKSVVAATNIQSFGEFIYTVNHRNSFHILQRIVAYIYRFPNNSTMPNNLRPTNKLPSPQELDSAVDAIAKAVQSADFKEEIKKLRNHKGIDNSSHISSLSPFLDENGVMRVGGRLEKSALSYEGKHQIILPYNDQISKLILTTLHIDNRHCGPQALLAISRQRYWIVKGLSMARNIVQNCVPCTRARPKLLKQIMGHLPASRVTPSRPFIKSGVDYCGPFWVHYKLRGKRPHKVYIAVFCCFATKAVHLEVVSDLTTDAFIGALKRFLSRRGRCQTIYSDNATNFVGACNQLQLEELNNAIFTKKSQENIIRACNEKGIEFKFIPPRTPHFGGLWEGAVKSAKNLLLGSVPDPSTLTYEELETVVIEIEAILNSRPITPISSNAADLTALTPGHFLIGEPLTAQVDSRATDPSRSLATRWRLVSEIKHTFWERWSTEYLHQLQEKHKWKITSPNIKEGELVIIKEDNAPVMKWPLGRITQVHKGIDGKVRVVDVKTASGISRRPICRLAPLLNEEHQQPVEGLLDNTQIKEPQRQRIRPADDADIIPPKRQKPPTNHLLLTLLTLILLIPAVLGRNINIQRFQAEPGIYFEGIGSAKPITAEWKLIVYYDLEPFLYELNALSSGVKDLQQACTTINQKAMCEAISSNFHSISEELNKEKEVFSARRSKRGAFNIVGNIARSLFGVLDSDYAEEMEKTINRGKEEKGHIVNLLKNQTSIIDATINILRQNEIDTKSRINEIQEKIKHIVNEIQKDDQQVSDTQLVGLLSSHLTLMATNLQRTETELINVLTDAHHGRISSLLLSPNQLKEELYTIKAHLPATRTLPIKEDNLIEFYKIMKAKGAVTKGAVIFEVSLPLVDQQTLELFKVIPVPTTKNEETLVAIAPESNFLAVNPHRDEYFPMSFEEINKCFISKNDEYICPNMLSGIRKESVRYSCEIQLFLNKSTRSCTTTNIHGGTMWTPMHNPNNWIFSMAKPNEMSAVCGTEPSQITLKGSGILQINANCILKGQDITIHGQVGASKIIHTSYANFRSLELLSFRQEQTYNLSNQKIVLHSDQFNALQQQLNESTQFHVQEIVQSNSSHHYAVSYTSLLLTIIILLVLAIWRFRPRRHEISPQPAPRNNITPFDDDSA